LQNQYAAAKLPQPKQDQRHNLAEKKSEGILNI